jgi:hypothetical protein
MTNVWEDCTDTKPVEVEAYTAQEATGQFRLQELQESEMLLTIGGASGSFLGLYGGVEDVRRVLVRAFDKLDEFFGAELNREGT